MPAAVLVYFYDIGPLPREAFFNGLFDGILPVITSTLGFPTSQEDLNLTTINTYT